MQARKQLSLDLAGRSAVGGSFLSAGQSERDLSHRFVSDGLSFFWRAFIVRFLQPLGVVPILLLRTPQRELAHALKDLDGTQVSNSCNVSINRLKHGAATLN